MKSSIDSLIADCNELLQFMSTDVDNDYKKFLQTADDYKMDAQRFYSFTNEAARMGEEVLKAVNEVATSINEVTSTIGQSAEGASQIAKEPMKLQNQWWKLVRPQIGWRKCLLN